MIKKIITLITFIPWILYYTVSILNSLKNDGYHSFSWDYLKKNFFHIFRIDLLFLIIIFFIFSSYKKQFVNQYLFAVICLYLWINSFYEKKEKVEEGFYKNHIFSLIVIFLIAIIPFVYYFLKNNLILTYRVLLLYLFFEYIIIVLVEYLYKFMKKFKKKN